MNNRIREWNWGNYPIYDLGIIGAAVGATVASVPTANRVTVTPVSPAAGQRVTAAITLQNIGNAPITVTSITANLIHPTTRVVQGHLGQMVSGSLPAAIAVNGTASWQFQMAQGIATQAMLPASLSVVWEIVVAETTTVYLFETPGAINVPAPVLALQMTGSTFGVIA